TDNFIGEPIFRVNPFFIISAVGLIIFFAVYLCRCSTWWELVNDGAHGRSDNHEACSVRPVINSVVIVIGGSTNIKAEVTIRQSAHLHPKFWRWRRWWRWRWNNDFRSWWQRDNDFRPWRRDDHSIRLMSMAVTTLVPRISGISCIGRNFHGNPRRRITIDYMWISTI